MSKAKKVAIIGAGPSGLVTAKTLLHHFPPGTFAPVVFEKNDRVGGLWAVDSPGTVNGTAISSKRPHRGFVDPFMRTNLSRFSVAFSDFSWDSVLDDKEADTLMFPRAWQVGRYLEKYAERYLPKDIIRLEHRVVRTVRERNESGSGGPWDVQWTSASQSDLTKNIANVAQTKKVESENFDFLVVTSGHFGSPHIPDLPGLANANAVHSSDLQNAEDIRHLLEKSPATKGKAKVVVIGGSMSGVEAAASLALHISSLNYNPDSPNKPTESAYQVHHISTRPFWVLPTYLPHQYSEKDIDRVPFLPLDLVLYDLSRRLPDPIKFVFGPTSSEQTTKVNQYFRNMLGDDYTRFGSFGIGIGPTAGAKDTPPYITIKDDYAEFVRSGSITITSGRAQAVHHSPSNSNSDPVTIEIETTENQQTLLTDVVAIITATGFTPSNSISYLPKGILSTLEFSQNDTFLPLILDGKGTSHTDIPDLGFVGFYRGAFWGPMEMQAQALAERWAGDERHRLGNETTTSANEYIDKARKERQAVRNLRNAHSSSRAQYPMADYVGFMEEFARDLGIHHVPIVENLRGPGPVVPARYQVNSSAFPRLGSQSRPQVQGTEKGVQSIQEEMNKTLLSLRHAIFAGGADLAYVGTASAIFRALQGHWEYTRVLIHDIHDTDSRRRTPPTAAEEVEAKGEVGVVRGTATFHPRYPSHPGYEREYLYEEIDDNGMINRLIYRLRENPSHKGGEAQVYVWSVDDQSHSPNGASELKRALRVFSVWELLGSGVYRVEGDDLHGSGLNRSHTFWFRGVGLLSWECISLSNCGDGVGSGGWKATYRRAT